MFAFEEVVTPPAMHAVDVGAMIIGDRDPFARLNQLGLLDVVGFEPLSNECDKLNALALPGRRYLPVAVADGRRREFYVTNTGMTSSLLRPDIELAKRFNGLAEYTQVVRTIQIDTVRLDDVQEVRRHDCDLLKLDTQGSEVEILENASEVLKSCLIVQAEAEFVQLYVNQPLFADVDSLLRRHGFMFHRFLGLSGRTFKPLMLNNDPHALLSQVLWTDAVYVPDLNQLPRLRPDSLIKLAALLHEIYGSYDLCHVVLAAHDERQGTAHAVRYIDLLAKQQQQA